LFSETVGNQNEKEGYENSLYYIIRKYYKAKIDNKKIRNNDKLLILREYF